MKNVSHSNVKVLMFGVIVCLLLQGQSVKADYVFGQPAPFGPPVNLHATEYSASISADGLELYYDDWDEWVDIYVATRATTKDDWGEPERLGPAVNTAAFEWTPRISADGLELYFASNRDGSTYNGYEIFVSRRDSKVDPWQPAEKLGPMINSSFNQTLGSISADGLELYYGTGNSYSSGNTLMIATRPAKNSPWTETRVIAPGILGASPAISPGGLHLVFSSDSLPGGMGDLDLWMMSRQSVRQDWSAPVNLGAAINNADMSHHPWILHDCSAILYTVGKVGGDVWQVPILAGWDFSLQPEQAQNPIPHNNIMDVPRNGTLLSWDPGRFAESHDLYFGISRYEVDSATVDSTTYLGRQLETSYALETLTFSQTYYWRVDEVNAAPGNTVFKGDVWSFEAEPYSIQISDSDIIATASSSSNDFSVSDKTVDGSGLGEDDTHTIHTESMWFTAVGDADPWIQYEFDGVKKLDIMKVWNSNSAAEGFIGYGVKEVKLEYSKDGETWTVFEDVNEFSRASGLPTYNQYDEIAFGGLAAKMVRFNIQNNWGGFIQSYSISEVQFYMIPTEAREPEPASGSVDILPNAVASWRAGRDAAQSTVYVSTDPNEVADGIAPSATSNTNSIDLSSFDLQMGQTYYWRVDEVNEAEVEFVWAGPVWSFSTVSAMIVDDFESYGNGSPDRPFQTWLDGFGYSADEYLPVAHSGNGTGSRIGHDIWEEVSPNYNGKIMEGTIAKSGQSMPFYYSNTGGLASQIDREFAAPQDWTISGAKSLFVWIFGQADNTGTLYIKINNTKKMYDGDLSLNIWQPWQVDLASLGIDLKSVTTLSFGVDGNGASGMVLIDEIGLYRAAIEPEQTVSLVNDFDALAVGSSMHGVPGWEGWFGGAQWGAKITDTVAYSGSNALEIVGNRDDLVPNWPRVDSGVYVATAMQYVPTGTDGLMYFGPLSAYGLNSATWLGTLLSNCTTGMVYVDELTAGRTEASLLRDQWVQLRVVMNFDANTCDFYYGDVLLGTLACPRVMGFDIWPDENVDVIYYDDFRFESL